MNRFKAALTCGAYNPANPEDLVRDKNGAFVLWEDVKPILNVLDKILQAHEVSSVDWPAMREAKRLLKNAQHLNQADPEKSALNGNYRPSIHEAGETY